MCGNAGVDRGGDLVDEAGPLRFDLFDPFFPDLIAPPRQPVELFRGVVPFDHRHQLQCFQKVGHRFRFSGTDLIGDPE